MHNPTKPTFTVQVAGGEFELRFEHRDFAEAEHRLRMPLLGPAAADFWLTLLPAHQLGVLLFVGLVHAIPGLTLDQARGFITYENMAQVEQIVTAAFAAAMPQPPEDSAGQGATEERPFAETSGSTPGASPSTTSDSQTPSSGA